MGARTTAVPSAQNSGSAECTFTHLAWNEFPGSRVTLPGWQGWQHGDNTVIGRQYLVRQAMTLLEFAKSTGNPELSAALVEKANDLKARLDETGAADKSPLAPDVEPEWRDPRRHSTGNRR